MTGDTEIHVNSRRLRTFAARLNSSTLAYQGAMDALQQKLGRLGSSWRDEDFQEFSTAVARVRRELETYIAEAKQAERRILDHAQNAEAIERVRLSDQG
jgi:uncharacterized protein YukE